VVVVVGLSIMLFQIIRFFHRKRLSYVVVGIDVCKL